MIVNVEKIKPEKKPMTKKIVSFFKKVNPIVKTLRYPVGEIERTCFCDAEEIKPIGAITAASVKAVTTRKYLEEPVCLPSNYDEESLKYATIRRTYSVRYKYTRFN